MRKHGWWMASIATLATPWMGPHIDRYIPIGRVLFRGGMEGAGSGFWTIAGVTLCLTYGVWLVLLGAIWSLIQHLKMVRQTRSGR